MKREELMDKLAQAVGETIEERGNMGVAEDIMSVQNYAYKLGIVRGIKATLLAGATVTVVICYKKLKRLVKEKELQQKEGFDENANGGVVYTDFSKLNKQD